MDEIKNLDFGSVYNRSKDALIDLAKKIKELKIIFKDPDNFIAECFSKLRNEIDLEREQLKSRVDKHFMELIDEVNLMELGCKQHSKSVIEKICDIKEIDNHHENLKEKLNQPKIDFEKWENITFESNEMDIKLKRIIRNLEADLVKNMRYKLEYSMKDVPIRTHIFKEPIIKEEIFDEYGIIPKVKCYFNELFNF